MSDIQRAPKPGARGDAFLKNPGKYIAEADKKNREKVVEERRQRRRFHIA